MLNAQSANPTQHNWMKKSQNMLVWLNKMVLAQHTSRLLVKGAAKMCTFRKDCNKYDLTCCCSLSVSDSSIIMIGLAGLLLVVLNYLVSSFSYMGNGWGFRK